MCPSFLICKKGEIVELINTCQTCLSDQMRHIYNALYFNRDLIKFNQMIYFNNNASFSVVSSSATLWTVGRQAPLSVGLFREEYQSELPFPSPEDLPSPEAELDSCVSPALQADSLLLSHGGSPTMPVTQQQELSKSESLLRQRACSAFPHFTSFNPHNNPMRGSPLLSPFDREKAEAQRSALPKVTQLADRGAGSQPGNLTSDYTSNPFVFHLSPSTSQDKRSLSWSPITHAEG